MSVLKRDDNSLFRLTLKSAANVNDLHELTTQLYTQLHREISPVDFIPFYEEVTRLKHAHGHTSTAIYKQEVQLIDTLRMQAFISNIGYIPPIDTRIKKRAVKYMEKLNQANDLRLLRAQLAKGATYKNERL